MTREELKAHCEKQIEMCELWAHGKVEELNNSKIYQEHKLILELLEQETVSKAQYERFSKKSEIVISQLRADRDRLLENLDKIKEVVAKWKVDGIDWDSIKEITNIIDKAEREEEE